MYLSKLEIFGFKSFAQKTSLKFKDGIACVIGPNGSGKSNIVDSIRWVLGEQRVSNLRLDKMENVIFNGTHSRKPLSMAEVSLTIQNNKNILDSEFSEVVISRRLYRSGESHYLINRTPCRLKDIIDLFMDTGMGANSYSVIELKMVESIISENQQERRVLFEEAAGITKYKLRRKSALRKLDATRQDMARISDLISEIQRTVNSLSRQVGKARRYLSLKDDLRKTEVDLARYRYTKLTDDIAPMERQLVEISKIKDESSHQITLEEAILEEYKREILLVEQQLNQINEQINAQDRRIQQLKEQDAVADTRSQSLKDTQQRNEQDILEYSDKSENLRKEIEQMKTEMEQIEIELDSIQEAFSEKDGEYQEFSAELRAEKQKIDELNDAFRRQSAKLNEKKQKSQQVSYQIEWNRNEIERLRQEQSQFDSAGVELEDQLKSLQEEQAGQSEQMSAFDREIGKFATAQEELAGLIQSAKDKLRDNEVQQKTISGRIQFYEQIISKYEGHEESTRFLMQHRDDFPGIHGPLSELVTTGDKYQLAVETALKDSLDYIVVDKVDTAKKILAEIRQRGIGRVTMLPLDRTADLQISAPAEKLPFPLLSGLIKTDAPYANIFNVLCGDIGVVENLEQALEAAKQYPMLRFVTIDGESLNAAYAISGGSKAGQRTSLVGRTDQLNKLKKELDNLQKQDAEIREELAGLEASQQDNQNQVTAVRQKHAEASQQLQQLQRQEDRVKYEMKSGSEAREKREETLQSLHAKIDEFETAIAGIAGEIEQEQAELDKLEGQTIALTNEFDRRNEDFRMLAEEVQDHRVRLINFQNRVENRKSEMARNERSIVEQNELVEKRKRENVDITSELEQIARDRLIREETKQKIWEERDKIEAGREGISQNYHELKNKILQLDDQIKRYRKQHDSSIERVRQLELGIKEKQMRSETIRERIREEYNEDITVGIAYEDLDPEQSQQQIETIKFKINQLGQVNPLAVNEYEKESERLEFYTKQYDDITDAEKSLIKTIEKINETARNQFTETFGAIKMNFEKIFGSFFERGEGTLQMEEGVDPLEADIDILVRPKGKRVQTISLLSGGEKTLTAISLLFAIYLVKPSPFCILDEVDAPLDDVNITRFTQALKKFSENTQFIIVTHNKRTMEAADTMYGVTMEEEGLSKIVSVEFN
jgi:chromosome segregation protein